ncbi:MAG TPA: signal peptidase II [Kofleriaceae bacterium]|jgi:signal peptidase II
MNLRRLVVFVTLAVFVLALDQGSKGWARSLPVGVPQPVVDGYWDWQLSYNDGVAFSTFAGGGGRVLLSVIAFAAVAAVGYAAARTKPEQRVKRVAYAAIAGGALGNVVDRVRDGAVTDFVRWHVHDHMWPIFNLADAALLVGVVLLITEGFLARGPAARRTLQA